MRGSWEGERDPLAALAAGDPGPFEELVRTEVTTFLGFFQRLGADPEEARDLTQEVFLKLFQHARRYRRSERFAAFAFRVARNAWVDRTRRRALRSGSSPRSGAVSDERDPLELVADAAPDAGEKLATSEVSRRLHAALATLTDGHRCVFELGVLQELGYREVSEILGIPVGTVKSRMFHAVRRLREALEDDGSEREERA